MSRCLPYGATIEALINPIKLQKEKSDKSKAKAERKEEKRAKKEQKQKEKEKRKDGEKRLVQKSLTVDSTKAVIKTTTTEVTTEQRERSDLTEEHGQPISSQQPSYSSDSTQNTQNSNKRKRDDAVLPDGAGGKQIKIRLLKKPRGPEPSKETVLPNVGRGQTPVRALNSVQGSGVADRNVVTSNGRNFVPTTSGRENIAPQVRQFSQTMTGPGSEIPRMKVNELQRQHVGMKQNAQSSVRPVPLNHLKQEVPSSHFTKTEVLPVPSQSRQNDVKLGQFSRQQQPIPSQGRPVVCQSRLELEMPRPSSHVKTGPSVLRRIDIQGPRYVGQQPVPSSGIPNVPASHLQHENITSASVLGKRSITEMTVPGVNGPSRSAMGVSVSGVPQKVGPTRSEKGKEIAVGEVPQKAGPTRLEKKKMKKNSKYEKLMVSWVPPVMAPCGGGGEDEDWLSKKGETVKSCSMDVDTCELAAPSLWQPCARFLVDADVYAMPYTVPF